VEYLNKPGNGERLAVDVVIPALNEQETIGDVVSTFRSGRNIGNVIVVSDLSHDRTSTIARNAGATVVKGPGLGKGQAMLRGLKEVKTPRVIFADADLAGLSIPHVNALAEPAFGMLVGFRDKGRFNFVAVSSPFPPIAGERSLPTRFVRSIPLEGYGAEMQINERVALAGMRVYHFIMRGVTGKMKVGPFRAIDVAPYARIPAFTQYQRLVRWLPPVGGLCF
jgi:glycosyltransferase involved in cell wall biosynthesis